MSNPIILPHDIGHDIGVDAHVIHNMQGNPDVSILLTLFRQTEPPNGADTSVRFD